MCENTEDQTTLEGEDAFLLCEQLVKCDSGPVVVWYLLWSDD